MKHEALIWTNWRTIMLRLSTSLLKTSLKILPLLFTFAVATSVLPGSSSGGYDPVAPILFPNLNVNGFFLGIRLRSCWRVRTIELYREPKSCTWIGYLLKEGTLENPHYIKGGSRKLLSLFLLISSGSALNAILFNGRRKHYYDEDQWNKIAPIRT